ncbi:MAG: SRPBCC family protein, partial [Candidatus Nanopelagicales bacterium]|nr:SRPBCC family protein [Candidatus Nanopelagicales bacterium]
MADRTHGEISINAQASAIMGVIADLAQYPSWSEGVESIDVLETFADGRPKVARFHFSSGPIQDTFVLRYEWNGNDSVSWWLNEGSVLKKQEGTYSIIPNSDGSMLVSYDLTVELAIP